MPLLLTLIAEGGRFDRRTGPSASGGCSYRRRYGLPNLRLVQECCHRGRNDSHAVRIGEKCIRATGLTRATIIKNTLIKAFHGS